MTYSTPLEGKIDQNIDKIPGFAGQITTGFSSSRNVHVKGSYAYVTSNGDQSVKVVDISNPSSPTEVGDHALSPSENPTGIYVAGQYAYVVTESGNNSLFILDISDPTTPVKISDLDVGIANLKKIIVSGKYAYITGESTTNGGLVIVDISDPANPSVTGTLNSGTENLVDQAYGIDVVGKYAYIACSEDHLTIVDISDPTTPVVAGGGTASVTDNTELNEARGIEVRGKYAYISCRTGNRLSVFDVSDPEAAPVFVTSTGTIDGASDVSVVGKYAYVVAEDDQGIFRVDISLPLPSGTGNLPLSGSLTSVMVGARGIYVEGGYAYVASLDNGDAFTVIDINGAFLPSIEAGSTKTDLLTVTSHSEFTGPVAMGSGLNVSRGITSQEGVTTDSVILNGPFQASITASASATETTNYTLPTAYPGTTGFSLTSSTSGILSWTDVSGGGGGSTVYDPDASNWTIKGSIIDAVNLDRPQEIFVQDGTAFIMSQQSSRLVSIDVSDPVNPVILQSLDLTSLTNAPGAPRGFDIDEKYIYFGNITNDGIYVINKEDPTDMFLEGYVTDALLGNIIWVRVQGKYLFACSNVAADLVVLDVSNPKNPFIVSNVEITGVHSCEIRDNVLFVVHTTNISSYDITDPYNLTLLDTLSATAGQFTRSKIVGNYYYGVSTNSLQIIDIADPGNMSIQATVTDATNIISPQAVDVTERFAFISVNEASNEGFSVYNIEDKSSAPVFVTRYTNASTADMYGFTIRGRYLYACGWTNDGLYIFDIGGIDTYAANIGKLNAVDVDIMGNLTTQKMINKFGIYTGGKSSIERLHLVDNVKQTLTSDMHKIGEVSDGTNLTAPFGLHVKGNFAYQGDGTGKFNVIDISNPRNPSVIGTLDDDTNLADPEYIEVFGNYAFIVVDGILTFHISVVDITDPKNPSFVSKLDLGSEASNVAKGIALKDGYLFTCSFIEDSLIAVDISDPANMHVVSSVSNSTTLNAPEEIIIQGDFAYVVCDPTTGRFTIVDISNPSSMTIRGSIADGTQLGGEHLDIQGNYVYCSLTTDDGMGIVDVSDPDAPVVVGSINTNSTLDNVKGIQVSGRYAYCLVTGTTDSIVRIDVSDPTNPFISGVFADSTAFSAPVGFQVQGNYAYTCSGGTLDNMVVIDLAGADFGHIETGNIKASSIVTLGPSKFDGDIYANKNLQVNNLSAKTSYMYDSFKSKNLILEDNDTGANTNTITLKAGDGTTNVTTHELILPPALNGSGPVVLTDAAGDGILSWAPGVDISGTSNNTEILYNSSDVITGSSSLTTNGSNIVMGATTYAAAGVTQTTGNYVTTISQATTSHILQLPDNSSSAFRIFGSGQVWNVNAEGKMQFYDTGAGTNTITLQAGDGTTPVTTHSLILPPTLGSAGSFLTDAAGDGVLSWGGLNKMSLTEVGTIANATVSAINSPRNVVVKDKIAYVASTDGGGNVAIIDVSDPTSMSEITSISTGNGATNVAINRNYLYVLTEDSGTADGNNVIIYDISNFDNISEVGRIDNGENGDTDIRVPKRIEISGNYAYISYEGNNDGIGIVDITNPSQPILMSYLNSEDFGVISNPYGIKVHNNLLYVVSSQSFFYIIDVSNPAKPEVLSYFYDNTNLNGARAVDVVDNYAYVAASSGDRLSIVDVRYPKELATKMSGADPVAATTTAGTLASDFEDGDTIDTITLTTGDRILIKDQADPIENGVYTVNASGAPTRVTEMNSAADDVFRLYVTIAAGAGTNNGKSFVQTNGLYPAPGTDALNFEEYTVRNFIVGSLNDGTNLNNISDLRVVGDYVLATAEDAQKVTAVDVSDPTTPTYHTDVSGTNFNGARGLFVDSEYVYVAARTANTGSLTVASLDNLTKISSSTIGASTIGILDVKSKSSFRGSVTMDNSLNVSGDTYSKKIAADVYSGTIKQKSEKMPVVLDNRQLNAAHNVRANPAVFNDYVVTVTDGGTLSLFSFKNNQIELITETTNASYANFQSMRISNGYLYCADDGNNGLYIIDLTTPDTIGSIVGSVTDGTKLGHAKDLRVSGNYCYVYSGQGVGGATGYLVVIDISDVTNPVVVGDVSSTDYGSAQSMDLVSETMVCLAAGSPNAVVLIDVSDPTSPSEAAKIVDGAGTVLDYAVTVRVRGDYIYVSTNGNKFMIYEGAQSNSSSGNTLQLVSEIGRSTLDYYSLRSLAAMDISGNYAYITATQGSASIGVLSVIDISDPTTPVFVGTVINDTLFDNGSFMQIEGNKIYLTNYTGYLTVVDIGGTEFTSIDSGYIKTDSLTASRHVNIQKTLTVNGGVNVGNHGINSHGPISAQAPMYFPSYTVATVPSATIAGGMIYVSDETGGAVMAFSDGTNWRRVTDRAIVS